LETTEQMCHKHRTPTGQKKPCWSGGGCRGKDNSENKVTVWVQKKTKRALGGEIKKENKFNLKMAGEGKALTEMEVQLRGKKKEEGDCGVGGREENRLRGEKLLKIARGAGCRIREKVWKKLGGVGS